MSPLVKKSPSQQAFENILKGAVRDYPWLKYIIPDPTDPTSYVHPIGATPPVAMTKEAFKEALEHVFRYYPKKRKQILPHVEKVAQGLLDPLELVLPFKEAIEHSDPGIFSMAWELRQRPSVRAKILHHQSSPSELRAQMVIHPKRADVYTPFHEVGHTGYHLIPELQRQQLIEAYEKLTPDEISTIQWLTKTRMHTPSEMLAESYARYVTESPAYMGFPGSFRDIVESIQQTYK